MGRTELLPDFGRAPALLAACCLAVALSGCEEDRLAPTSDFTSDNCDDPNDSCSGGVPRIPIGGVDAGAGGSGDGGAGTGGDGGVTADVGTPDLGVPDLGPPPSEFLDLNGTRPTAYVFDISGYLLGISNLAQGTDWIDQALNGNVDLGNGVLNSLVAPLLDNFFRQVLATPEGQRFAIVIDVLNQTAHLFEEIEARGQMTITQTNPADPYAPTAALSATEVWHTMFVRMIAQCPQGRQTMSPPNPLAFPDCANVAVPITSSPTPIMTGSSSVDIQIYVEPFAGTLEAGVPEADFVFVERDVEMELTKLILLAFDLAIRYSSSNQYQGMEDLFRNTVCVAVSDEAERLAISLGLSSALATLARTAARDECVDLLVNQLTNNVVAQIGVDWDAFEYDQHGHAIDRNGDRRPEVLQTHSIADSIRGRFRFALSTRLGGTWASP